MTDIYQDLEKGHNLGQICTPVLQYYAQIALKSIYKYKPNKFSGKKLCLYKC